MCQTFFYRLSSIRQLNFSSSIVFIIFLQLWYCTEFLLTTFCRIKETGTYYDTSENNSYSTSCLIVFESTAFLSPLQRWFWSVVFAPLVHLYNAHIMNWCSDTIVSDNPSLHWQSLFAVGKSKDNSHLLLYLLDLQLLNFS